MFSADHVQAVPLANMMLQCLERPEQSVADAALEYISCLDYVAMTDRHPQLQVRPQPTTEDVSAALRRSFYWLRIFFGYHFWVHSLARHTDFRVQAPCKGSIGLSQRCVMSTTRQHDIHAGAAANTIAGAHVCAPAAAVAPPRLLPRRFHVLAGVHLHRRGGFHTLQVGSLRQASAAGLMSNDLVVQTDAADGCPPCCLACVFYTDQLL